MFNFITNLFPLKTKSKKIFIKMVKENNCSQIYVYGQKNSDRDFTLEEVKYEIMVISKTSKGRKIVYKKPLFEQVFGLANFEERGISAIKILLIAEKLIHELKEEIPEAEVILVGPDDCPMDDKTFNKLHVDAKRLGVSV